MYKKLLSGVLAAAMVVGGAAYAAQPQTAAEQHQLQSQSTHSA